MERIWHELPFVCQDCQSEVMLTEVQASVHGIRFVGECMTCNDKVEVYWYWWQAIEFANEMDLKKAKKQPKGLKDLITVGGIC